MGSPPLRLPSREKRTVKVIVVKKHAWWLRMPGRPNMKREVMMRRLSQALSPRSKIVIELLITGLVRIPFLLFLLLLATTESTPRAHRYHLEMF